MGNALEGGKYNGMFKDVDVDAYLNKEHTGKFIGREGNAGYAYWNPETDSYVRQTYDDYKNTSLGYRDDNNNDNMLSAYYNKFGDFVSGVRPENTYMTYVGGIPTLHSGKDPIDPNPEWLPDPTNKTGVPLSIRNPDYDPTFVNTQSRFKDAPTGGFGISYNSNGLLTPKAAWENKIANFNPDERAAWESNVEGMLTGMLNETQPATPGQDVVYTGQEAFDFARDYANRFHEGKGDAEQHQANMDEAKEFSKDSSLLQSLGDHAIETRTGVQEFLNTARSLHMYNPEAFEEWELKNPEMALRYHARAAAGNGNVGGIEGYDHAGRAQALSYGISQQLGYGEDGKQDGKAIAYNFDTFNDLQSENGDGDFWKLGTPNTFTNDLSDFIEDNPLKVAGTIALGAFAPAVVGAVGLSGISAGVAAGALTSVGNNIIMGNTDDLLMSAIKGGLTGGLGSWASGAEGILVQDFGWNESVANIATNAVGDAVANGTDPVQALITAAGAEGVTIALGAAKDAVGEMFSTDELEIKIGDDGTSTGTINQEALDEMDFLSKNPEALEEIDLGTIPSPRPPSSPSIPGPRDDGMLTGGSEGPAADIGDDGLDWDNIESAGTGPSQESIAANNKAAVEAAERMANLNPGDEGFREAWDELARVHTGDLLTAGGNAPAGAVEYHTKATIEKAYDAVFGHGAYQTKLGQSDDAFDAMVEELTTPKLSGTVELNRDQIPDPIYNPRDPQTPDGPLFEPDMPDLNMGFDEQDIILDSMDNTFTPDRFEPQWKLPEEEVKKVTQDILGGGGNLASSTSDALEGAIGDAPEIVQEAAESILGDIGDNIGDVDLSALGDMSLPSREQVVEGVRVALGTVGASLDDISTEVTLGNGDVVEVSLEDSILGNDPQGPAGGNEGSPGGTPGAPDGTVGAPSGTPGQPPTPNSNLPEGIAWEPNGTGGWNIRNSNTGEVFTQKEFADAIYGSLVNGTGTTDTGTGTSGSGTSGSGSGSHPGVVGGIHAGTGQSVIGNSGTGGTGGGTGGGNGAGDGPGDGFGGGSDTPLADGLMRSLGQGTNIPTGLVDIPQVAPIQTRPLDWSFLRKVSEGRG